MGYLKDISKNNIETAAKRKSNLDQVHLLTGKGTTAATNKALSNIERRIKSVLTSFGLSKIKISSGWDDPEKAIIYSIGVEAVGLKNTSANKADIVAELKKEFSQLKFKFTMSKYKSTTHAGKIDYQMDFTVTVKTLR